MLRTSRAHSLARTPRPSIRRAIAARLLSSLIIAGASLLLPASASASDQPSPPATSQGSVEMIDLAGLQIRADDPAWDEYRWQIEQGGAPAAYWVRVAKCETRGNWHNGGRWSGGLGIYNQARFTHPNSGTWERWGGEQFALKPEKASPLQQIVVANRIAMFGWRVTYRDWGPISERVIQKVQYKQPAGFNGWGCIKQHRNGKQPGRWHINLNPTRFERARDRYWATDQPPYRTHEITLPRMNIPRWAYERYASQPGRLR